MKERAYPRATVTPKAEKSLRGGHPWIYADEIISLSATPEDGGLVDAYASKDKYLGTGFYNSHSKIRIRILSRNTNDTFDGAYWERRLRYAVAYRRTVSPGKPSASPKRRRQHRKSVSPMTVRR